MRASPALDLEDDDPLQIPSVRQEHDLDSNVFILVNDPIIAQPRRFLYFHWIVAKFVLKIHKRRNESLTTDQ